MKIYVTIKQVYGNDLIYPACDMAAQFARLTKTKTLTTDNIKAIRLLGHKIEVVPPVNWARTLYPEDTV